MKKAINNTVIKPHFPHVVFSEKISNFKMSSPFKDVSVAFNWLNTDYPALHEHNYWELFFIVNGSIIHTINGEDTIMNPGDACLIRPTDRHKLCSCNKSTSIQHINFLFTSDIAELFLSPHLSFEQISKHNSTVYFSLTQENIHYFCKKLLLVQNLPKEEYEKRTKLILNNLFLILAEQTLTNTQKYPVWLSNFLETITDPSYFSYTIEELAKNTPYGYSRLAHIVKEYTGKTIISFVKNAKMTYAKRLLRTTDLNIKQIAETLGYYSVNTFISSFKSIYNLSPLKYKSEHNATIK